MTTKTTGEKEMSGISTVERKSSYWVDNNGNKWDKSLYNEQQASESSASLINCEDCKNCRDK